MSSINSQIEELTESLAGVLMKKRWRMATVESCTGGWIAKCCTDLPGSSNWFNGGLVTYSNAAKIDLVQVPAVLLEDFGAVSEEAASAMVEGGARALKAEVALAVTGIAGPGGGSVAKPVGLVCFSWLWPGLDRVQTESRVFAGDRTGVRQQTVVYSLRGLLLGIQSVS